MTNTSQKQGDFFLKKSFDRFQTYFPGGVPTILSSVWIGRTTFLRACPKNSPWHLYNGSLGINAVAFRMAFRSRCTYRSSEPRSACPVILLAVSLTMAALKTIDAAVCRSAWNVRFLRELPWSPLRSRINPASILDRSTIELNSDVSPRRPPLDLFAKAGNTNALASSETFLSSHDSKSGWTAITVWRPVFPWTNTTTPTWRSMASHRKFATSWSRAPVVKAKRIAPSQSVPCVVVTSRATCSGVNGV